MFPTFPHIWGHGNDHGPLGNWIRRKKSWPTLTLGFTGYIRWFAVISMYSSVIAGDKDVWNGFQKHAYSPHAALLGTQHQRLDGDTKQSHDTQLQKYADG